MPMTMTLPLCFGSTCARTIRCTFLPLLACSGCGAPSQASSQLRCRSNADDELIEVLVPGTLLAAGPHWGCLDPETGAPKSLLERVTRGAHVITVSSGNGTNTTSDEVIWLELRTEEAGYEAFFEHLELSFRTERYPHDHFSDFEVARGMTPTEDDEDGIRTHDTDSKPHAMGDINRGDASSPHSRSLFGDR